MTFNEHALIALFSFFGSYFGTRRFLARLRALEAAVFKPKEGHA